MLDYDYERDMHRATNGRVVLSAVEYHTLLTMVAAQDVSLPTPVALWKRVQDA